MLVTVSLLLAPVLGLDAVVVDLVATGVTFAVVGLVVRSRRRTASAVVAEAEAVLVATDPAPSCPQ